MNTIKTSKVVFVGDIGVLFRVYSKTDLSTATSIIMKVKKASGVTVSWTASVASDNNYYAEYTSVEDDFNIEGDYLLSLEVITPAIEGITGRTAIFPVRKQFEDC